MKFKLVVLFVCSFMFAQYPYLIQKKIITDAGLSSSGLHYSLYQATIIDSGDMVGLALQNQECVSFNPIVDAVAITNRNFNPTGILNVHTAPGDLSFWQHDYSVYSQQLGPGRYPTAIAGSQGPYISFPWLTSMPAWGGAGAQFCSGGWFSGIWDPPVDIGPGDQKCQTVIGKELSNGNMCFILYSTDPYGLQYRTYNDSLTALLDSGWVTPTPCYYWGWDYNINAGIGYVFYVDHYISDSMDIFYRTTTDGISWSPEQMYNIVWPNPYVNNYIRLSRGCQAVVTDNGDPLLVFANMNGDDPDYPQYGKIYVSHTEGQPCVEVSSTFGMPDTQAFYSTIATAGNMAAVTYLTPRNSMQDSMAWHDIHISKSYDNGITWGIPENITSWSNQRVSLPQLAKRLDITRERAYILYAIVRLPSRDMDLMWAYDNGSSPSVYFNLLYASVGVEEREVEFPEKISLNVFPNPVVQHSRIIYTLPVSGDISLKLFSVDGRMVKIIDQGHKAAGLHIVSFNTNEFASGTYFIILECNNECLTEKLVLVK